MLWPLSSLTSPSARTLSSARPQATTPMAEFLVITNNYTPRFAFPYCSWGSHGKNTGVVCHSLLQWTTFFQNPSLWMEGGKVAAETFYWVPKSWMVTAAMKLKDAPWKESYDKPRQYIKKQRHQSANKGPYSWNYGFSSSHVWMWELGYKESWALKNWCFWCWRRRLRVPWTARRSNHLILKEISPEYSKDWCWSWDSNTLATWYEELIPWKRP